MRKANRKPVIQYRFKDTMGCVFFKTFQTDREARLWFDRNKAEYCLRELGSVCSVFPGSNNMITHIERNVISNHN